MTAARLDPDNLATGSLVGGYRIERLLGRGAFGTVYAATRSTDGARAALKVMSGRVLEQTGGVERFRREAELARRLRHPNVVQVLDAGMDGGLVFTAFELLHGQSLEEVLRRGPIDPARAAALAVDVLAGLEEAHRLGIVHRDVKPANLHLEGGDGRPERVKLLDFGVAKSTNPNTVAGLTRDGLSLGTPAYMAPEQLAGLPVTPATDLFAFGLVLAELLMGRLVYGPEVDALSILKERLSGQRPPLPEALLASPLGAIIARATTPDPAQRTQSASEMRAAIQAVLATIAPPRPAAVVAPAPPPPRAGSSRAPLVIAGAAVALAVVAGAGWLFVGAAAPRPERAETADDPDDEAPTPKKKKPRSSGSPAAPPSASVAPAAPAEPERLTAMPLAVGQWIRMKSTHGGNTSEVEYRVVGKRDAAWVFEVDVDKGKVLTEIVLTFKNRDKLEGVELKSARVKTGGRTIDLPSSTTGPLLEQLKTTLRLPDFDPSRREDVTVAAGTFRGTFVRDVDETMMGKKVVQRTYAHPSVPINALVKSEGTIDKLPSTTELLAYGVSGAKATF